MAIFNEILSGRYNRALQKIFAIKGAPPVRQVGGEIMPVMAMAYGVEMRYLELWNRYGVGFSIGPVAAQFNNFRIRNPQGSNTIAVLEKLHISSAANDTYDWGRILAAGVLPVIDLTAAQNGVALDLRQLKPGLTPGPSNSVVRVSRDTGSSPATDLFGMASALANTCYEVITEEQAEIPLAPGEVFQLDSSTVNTKIVIGCIWRERALEESERI